LSDSGTGREGRFGVSEFLEGCGDVVAGFSPETVVGKEEMFQWEMGREKIDEGFLNRGTKRIVREVDRVQFRVIKDSSEEISQRLRNLSTETSRKDISELGNLQVLLGGKDLSKKLTCFDSVCVA
jgi:DNA-directed RNA polymerase subunit E'/Rpb7